MKSEESPEEDNEISPYEDEEEEEEDFTSPFSEKVDDIRNKFRDTLERWSAKPQTMIRGFLNSFEKGSEKVEDMVHKAFNFKSL